jgi:hypothetical protein
VGEQPVGVGAHVQAGAPVKILIHVSWLWGSLLGRASEGVSDVEATRAG